MSDDEEEELNTTGLKTDEDSAKTGTSDEEEEGDENSSDYETEANLSPSDVEKRMKSFVNSKEMEQMQGVILDVKEAKDMSQPSTISDKITLHDYQKVGLSWLINLHKRHAGKHISHCFLFTIVTKLSSSK